MMQSRLTPIISAFLFLTLPFQCLAMDDKGGDSSPLTIEIHKNQEEARLSGKGQAETEETGIEEPRSLLKLSEGPLHASWGIIDSEVEKVFTTSPNLVCILELGKYIKRINAKNWTEVLGWSEQELLGKPYYEFIHPDDIGKTLEYEKYLIPTGFVNRLVCKSGVFRWLSWLRFSVSVKAAGDSCFCILTDVTVDHLLREEENEKKIRLLNEHLQIQSNVINAVTDLQKLYLGELGRYSNEEDIRLSLQHLIQHFIKLSQSQSGFIGTVLNEGGNSSIRFKSWETNPSLSEESQIMFQECNQETGSLCNLHPFLNQILTTRKILIVGEEKMPSQATEVSSSERPFKTFLGVPLLCNDELVGLVALVNRPYGYNQQLVEWLKPLFSLSAHIVNEANLSHFRQEAEKEKQARQEAEAKDEAKSKFLAHISHELRTPLSGLLGFLELINTEDIREEYAQYLQMAKDSGATLLSIINDVLDISKIEAGKAELEAVEFSPIRTAKEAIQALSIAAERKDLPIKLKINPSIPDMLIGDPTRIRQIFTNLIGNSVKFTEKGHITVQLEGHYESEGTDKDTYTLIGTIRDTGMGMSPLTQRRIFQPFIQAEQSITRQFGGTGLGLTITKSLCEMMRGGLEIVRSEKGQGSTFQFKVPLRMPNFVEQKNPIEMPENLPSLHILVAEDNKVNQLVLKTLLQQRGFRVKTANNGLEALQCLEQEPNYDMILMDVSMPVMDGFEATREIRRLYGNSLPIIGVTAHVMENEKKLLMEAGVNGYVIKPIQKCLLLREITRCLKEKETKKQ